MARIEHKIIPNDWTPEDGYILYLFCAPDSLQWDSVIGEMFHALKRGRRWDGATGNILEVQQIAREIEDTLMACRLDDLVVAVEALNASVQGINTQLTNVVGALNTDNEIYPDMSIADILQSGLIGRQIDIPWPFAGTGLADILDEQGNDANAALDSLDGRFRQTDLSGLSTEKNITETLEKLLRTDVFTDYEFFTPNLVTVLRQLFTVGVKPGEEYAPGVVDEIKQSLSRFLDTLGLPPTMLKALKERLDIKQNMDAGDLLYLIAGMIKKLQASTAALEVITNVNVNNLNNCNGGTPKLNGNGDVSKITITDEGVLVEGDPPLLGGGG